MARWYQSTSKHPGIYFPQQRYTLPNACQGCLFFKKKKENKQKTKKPKQLKANKLPKRYISHILAHD